MLSSTLWRALTAPVTYVLVAILVGTAVMQVRYVNKALQRFDSTQVIPVQFVMFTLSVIIGSAVLYRDFEKATAENVVKFVGGCLLTFFGVWLITSARANKEREDDEEGSDEDGEERIILAEQDSNEANYSDDASERLTIARKGAIFQNGDSTNDEDVADSRRSSHVSFVDPSLRPQPARVSTSSSQKPQIGVITTAPSDERSSGTEQTPLLSNPWKKTSENTLHVARHPGMQATTSSPVLPSEAQVPSENSKPPNHRSSTHGHLHTHPTHQQSPTLPDPDRPFTPARNSISRMMPGPLLSPLSGGLSVVIADSLRRGVESPIRSRPFKRGRLGLRRSKSGSQRPFDSNGGSDEALGTSPDNNEDATHELGKSLGSDRGSWSGMTRARSLSNTLSGLFRGKAQQINRSSEADEEPGPSGS